MKKFTYKNKKTGKTIQSDKPLKDANLVLVTQIRDGQMKSNQIKKK